MREGRGRKGNGVIVRESPEVEGEWVLIKEIYIYIFGGLPRNS